MLYREHRHFVPVLDANEVNQGQEVKDKGQGQYKITKVIQSTKYI